MTYLIVKNNQVKVSQNGCITYIYDCVETSVKSLIQELNKETDNNLDDRLIVDDILYI